MAMEPRPYFNQQHGRFEFWMIDPATGTGGPIEVWAGPDSDLTGITDPSIVKPMSPETAALVGAWRQGNAQAGIAMTDRFSNLVNQTHETIQAANQASMGNINQAASTSPGSISAGSVFGASSPTSTPGMEQGRMVGVGMSPAERNALVGRDSAVAEAWARGQHLDQQATALAAQAAQSGIGRDQFLTGYDRMGQQVAANMTIPAPAPGVQLSPEAIAAYTNQQRMMLNTALDQRELELGNARQALSQIQGGQQWAGQNQNLYRNAAQAENDLTQAEADAMSSAGMMGGVNPERATRNARQNVDAARLAVRDWEMRHNPVGALRAQQTTQMNATYGAPAGPGVAPSAASPQYAANTAAPRYLVGADGSYYENPNDGADPRDRLGKGQLAKVGPVRPFASGGMMGALPMMTRDQDPTRTLWESSQMTHQPIMDKPQDAPDEYAQPWLWQGHDGRGMPLGYGQTNQPFVYSGQAFKMADGGMMPEDPMAPTTTASSLMPSVTQAQPATNTNSLPPVLGNRYTLRGFKNGGRTVAPPTGFINPYGGPLIPYRPTSDVTFAGGTPAAELLPTPPPITTIRNPDGTVNHTVPAAYVHPSPEATAIGTNAYLNGMGAVSGTGAMGADTGPRMRPMTPQEAMPGVSKEWATYLSSPAGAGVASVNAFGAGIPAEEWAKGPMTEDKPQKLASGGQIALPPVAGAASGDGVPSAMPMLPPAADAGAQGNPNAIVGEGLEPGASGADRYRGELVIMPDATGVYYAEGPIAATLPGETRIFPVMSQNEGIARDLPPLPGSPAEDTGDGDFAVGGKTYRTGGKTKGKKGKAIAKPSQNRAMPAFASGGQSGVWPNPSAPDAPGPAANWGAGITGAFNSSGMAGYQGGVSGSMPTLAAFQSYNPPKPFQAQWSGTGALPTYSLFGLNEHLQAQGFGPAEGLPMVGKPFSDNYRDPGFNMNSLSGTRASDRRALGYAAMASGMRGGLDDYLDTAKQYAVGTSSLPTFAG